MGISHALRPSRVNDTDPDPRDGPFWLTPCFQIVLREVIKDLGGWEAAVFLDSGGVNVDVDVSAWPPEDQVP